MIRYIKLRCKGCSSETCEKKPIGCWTTDGEGCIKEVSAIDGDKYFYYVIELKPQLRKMDHYQKDLWDEMQEFIYYIHDKPAGERFKNDYVKKGQSYEFDSIEN